MRLSLRHFCALITIIAVPCFGQVGAAPAPGGAPEVYNSRTEEIEAARRRKAAQLRPEETSGTERFLVEFKEKRMLEKIMYGIGGLRPRIGALVSGSGFAAGPEFYRDDLRDGNVLFRVTTQFSTKQYELYDIEFTLPRLASNRAFLTLQGTHRNFTQMPYYGPGPDSLKTGRSNYRLEDSRYRFVTGLRPFPHLTLGATGGFLEVNIGGGTNERYISTEQQYSAARTTGIDHQTDFLQGGAFVDYDYRDVPGGPRSGGFYSASLTYNKDSDLHLHSHKRLQAEVQQYIPFFNERRVIALRGRTDLTWKNAGQTLPFYMQPTLGGSRDLRGFRPFRFYGDNSLLFNAEYRYEVFSGLDMAVFGDAGKVFQSKSDLNLRDLEGSYGIGMRFNARNVVFMRLDAGFSHEGFQVWLTFNNVF
jgi:outer membrane protein assembly factor BamA